MRFCLVLLLMLIILGCGGANKKTYAPLQSISHSLKVSPAWVSIVGQKFRRQHRQLGVTLHENTIYVGNGDGSIYALKRDDGKIKWKRKYNLSIASGPTIEGNSIYVGTNDAELVAINKQTGAISWIANMSSEVLSDPVIAGNKIIVQTIDGKVSALDIANGEKIWSESREVPALTLRGTSSPKVIDNKVIAGFSSGKLAAFELESGKQIWEMSLAVPRGRTDLQRMVDIDGLLQGDGHEIYVVSYQGRIAAVSVDSGHANWSRDMSSYSGVVISGNQLYVTDAEDNVWSLDRKTGATLWRQDALADRDLSAPVVMGDTIVVADGAGYLHWLSRDDGSFVARHNLQQAYDSVFVDWGGDEPSEERDLAVTTPLQVVDSHLYVRDNEGGLTVYLFGDKKKTSLNQVITQRVK